MPSNSPRITGQRRYGLQPIHLDQSQNVGIDGDGVSHGADLVDNAADDDVSVTVEDVDDEVVQQRVDRAQEAGCADGLSMVVLGLCGTGMLDQGSISVRNNGVKLGVLQSEGLSGPL